MDLKEFAAMLDGRVERLEITRAEEKQAEELGFVVVFGYSDDNMEFRGAINDEFGCYEGGTAYITKDRLFDNCECECKSWYEAKKRAKEITAIWHYTGEYTWTYETNIPHETFSVLDEEGDKWCRGIVFDINNLG